VQGWGVPHFGLFWNEIRPEYPLFEVKSPLRTVSRTGGAASPAHVEFQLVDIPDLRCWFIDESKSRLLQLQDDRLIINWRKVRRDDTLRYPKYSANRASFEREWSRYREFLRREGLGDPPVTGCEVSYINHIEKGGCWKSFNDLHKVFTRWAPPSYEAGLPNPDAVSVSIGYEMPKENLRLDMEIVTAIRHGDFKEVIQFTLTARGVPDSGTTEDVLNWLDRAHDVVAKAFKELTTEQVRDTWRERSKHGNI
jgi:uncharacterized protein (TIGR04255 family)